MSKSRAAMGGKRVETAGYGGLGAWLLERWRGRQRAAAEPRLALIERIALAPRQSLALVEAEGRRILVAISAEGGPAFYPLGQEADRRTRMRSASVSGGRARIS